jgi:cyclopentanol dehydrogenase
MARLDGKVALISGGARGQGAAVACLFAKEGARVVLGDLLESEGTKVAAKIVEVGGEAVFVRLDVTCAEDWIKAIDMTVARFGKLDVLVNNAGILRRNLVEDTSVEEWDQVMAVNAKGVFLGTKHVLGEMRKAGGGSIINVSSTLGLVGSYRSAAYTASKGAVRLLTKSTALQYGAEGIRANSIHPGPIWTDMIADTLNDPEALRVSMEGTALGRLGRPEEVAYGALFLASDESSFVTGSELVIDGGVTAK